MEITVTLNVPSLDRLCDLIEGGASIPTTAPAAKPKAPKSEPTPAPAAKSKPAASDTSEEADSDVPSAEELKAAAIQLSSANGREALEAALKEHGATKGISTIPDDKKAAFLKHCEEAVA